MTNIIKKLVKDLEKNEGITLGNDVLPYVEKAIQQAIAEERERVVGIIEGLNEYKHLDFPDRLIRKADLLSSLDTLTDKE